MRVHPLSFLAMAVVMPVTYIVCTTLAMFTLDSSSWEARGHGRVVESMAIAPSAETPVGLVPVVATASAQATAGQPDFEPVSSPEVPYPAEAAEGQVQA
jgi:hypothetical protein